MGEQFKGSTIYLAVTCSMYALSEFHIQTGVLDVFAQRNSVSKSKLVLLNIELQLHINRCVEDMFA